jgi:hypothetical protein
MAYRLKIEPEAELDVFRAFRDYETMRRGLGRRFATRLQDVLGRIVVNPEIHAITFRNVRQTLVRKFPFVVCYTFEANTVSVIAVFHTSRSPEVWQLRVE